MMCLTRSPTLGLGCSLPLQLSPPLSYTHLNVPAQVVRPSAPPVRSLVLTVLAERYGLLLMLTSCKVGASSERSTAARIHILSFATGYPGIPPGGQDRPQAAVKGVRGCSLSGSRLCSAVLPGHRGAGRTAGCEGKVGAHRAQEDRDPPGRRCRQHFLRLRRCEPRQPMAVSK